MNYTDKELQISTQIAYMDITQEQIGAYVVNHSYSGFWQSQMIL